LSRSRETDVARPQKTGATEHAATGIAVAMQEAGPRDPFEQAFDNATEQLVRTSAAKARAEAPDLNRQQRAEARRAYQQKRAEVNRDQAERRKPKPTYADWKAHTERTLRALGPEERARVQEGEWFGKLRQSSQDFVMETLAAVEQEEWASPGEYVEYDEPEDDAGLVTHADGTVEVVGGESDETHWFHDPETDLVEEVDSGWAA
jgi:hypothetical protein